MTQTIFFFGSHPDLSYAELQAVCTMLLSASSYTLTSHEAYGMLVTEHNIDAQAFMNRLGGTIKIAEVINVAADALDDWLCSTLPEDKKNIFGISVYSAQSERARLDSVRHIGMSLKRSLQASDRSVRFVQSQEPTLSAVIVTKEHLIDTGCDLCIVSDATNKKIFARTIAVQPFEEFSERDYGRPGRDSKSGMLPPKLARMMVNLSRATSSSSLLDPFCGSGTVLQEALLMGVKRVYGSDISEKATADTARNLKWLNKTPSGIVTCAAEHIINNPSISAAAPFDCIVFEGYLGSPKPYERDIPLIQAELNTLYIKAFNTLSQLLAHSGTIVAALPFWLLPEFDERLDVARILDSNRLALEREPLYYFRPHARVGREILVIKKQ